MNDPNHLSLPPELDEQYSVRGILGSGGMGVVYRAYHRTLKRDVALKLILSKQASSLDVARFVREGKLLGKLSHPRIVRVFDGGIVREFPFLVMELLKGTSLFSDPKSQTLAEHEVVELLRAILEGLAVVHSEGILHRDLKPANVFMERDRGPVLIDFGLARWNEGGTILTKSGHVVGTPQYLAPELLKDETPTVRTDIFAVGLIGMRALLGELPHAPTTGGGRTQDRDQPDPVHDHQRDLHGPC